MTDLLTEIADTISLLVDPWQHAEAVRTWDHNRHAKIRWHRTAQDSLMDQLAEAAFPSAGADGDASAVAYASRPPANLEAVAAHSAITIGATKWAWSLGAQIRDTPADTLRGLATKADVAEQRELLRELQHWLRWARIVTQWESPPWRPAAPCPQCGHRGGEAGGLLVNLTAETAICTACRASWGDVEDDPPLALLAEHVRAYRIAADGQAAEARVRALAERRKAVGAVAVATPRVPAA
jgi:hypothetical protein